MLYLYHGKQLGYKMVKVILGLQVTMFGEVSAVAQVQWALTVQQQMQRHGVTIEAEVYDVIDGNTLLRVWVKGTPAQVSDAAELCQMVAACSSMFMQLESATADHVQAVNDVCKAHKLDCDMYMKTINRVDCVEGIAYMHTAPQLRAVMSALIG